MINSEKAISRISALLLVFIVAGVIGFGYRHYRIWPTDEIFELKNQLSSFREVGVWGRSGKFMKAPNRATDDDHVLYQPDRLLSGYRAYMGYEVAENAYTIRMYDENLELVNRWYVRHGDLSPDGTGDPDLNPHGLEILPDGSAVVNFGVGSTSIARIDTCSRPVWIAPGAYHHSVQIDPDTGSIWTWRAEHHNHEHFQSIMELDAETGRVLRDISLPLDVVKDDPKARLAFGIPSDFEFREWSAIKNTAGYDIFHPNDVEPLAKDMADAFPMFDAGDLLISLRNSNNAVAVLDGSDHSLKWWMNGPWVAQHDPDFQPDGTILVYDNGARGQSNVIRVNPQTLEVDRLPVESEARFFSKTEGKLQALPNGNILITAPREGRAIELTPDGSLVHEFQNIANEDHNAWLVNAMWFPKDYFVGQLSCPTQSRNE